MDNIQETLRKQAQMDDTLREIFEKHFKISDEENLKNAGYQAYARYAVEAAVELANVILAVKDPASGRTFRAIQNLTYVLSANEFWSKNINVLVPVLTVVLNSHSNSIDMLVERSTLQEYALYDHLVSGGKTVALELFCLMLYLVGGPVLMAHSSTDLKLDLAPYLVR